MSFEPLRRAHRKPLWSRRMDCSSPRPYWSCRPAAVSTSTLHCCRAGAGRRRSSGRSWRAMRRPASPSCRWTKASIPDLFTAAKRRSSILMRPCSSFRKGWPYWVALSFAGPSKAFCQTACDLSLDFGDGSGSRAMNHVARSTPHGSSRGDSKHQSSSRPMNMLSTRPSSKA